MENARQWGRFIMEAMINSVCHNIAEEKEPGAALQKFEMYGKMLYRFNDPKFQALKLSLNQGTTPRRLSRPTIRSMNSRPIAIKAGAPWKSWLRSAAEKK